MSKNQLVLRPNGIETLGQPRTASHTQYQTGIKKIKFLKKRKISKGMDTEEGLILFAK